MEEPEQAGGPIRVVNGKTQVLQILSASGKLHDAPQHATLQEDDNPDGGFNIQGVAIHEGVHNGVLYTWEDTKTGSPSLQGKQLRQNHGLVLLC